MRSAIITGASSGIGRSIALKMAESREFDCIAVNSGHDEQALIRVAAEMKEIYNKAGSDSELQVITVFGDISEIITARAMVRKTVSVAERVDVLINSAAISHVGLLMDMTPEEWQKTVAVNLNSVYNTCHEVLPYMVRASCEVAYSAAKGGVNAFTKALAKEMAPSHISVNALAFGMVDTRMNGHLSEEEKAEIYEAIPAGRAASPDEAAEAVLKLLAMPEYLTGEVIKCDGGWI